MHVSRSTNRVPVVPVSGAASYSSRNHWSDPTAPATSSLILSTHRWTTSAKSAVRDRCGAWLTMSLTSAVRSIWLPSGSMITNAADLGLVLVDREASAAPRAARSGSPAGSATPSHGQLARVHAGLERALDGAAGGVRDHDGEHLGDRQHRARVGRVDDGARIGDVRRGAALHGEHDLVRAGGLVDDRLGRRRSRSCGGMVISTGDDSLPVASRTTIVWSPTPSRSVPVISSKAPPSTCTDSDPLAPSVVSVTSATPSALVHAVLAVTRRRADGQRVLDRRAVRAALVRQEEVGDDGAVRQLRDRVEVDLLGDLRHGLLGHEHVAGEHLVDELEVGVLGELGLVLEPGEGVAQLLGLAPRRTRTTLPAGRGRSRPTSPATTASRAARAPVPGRPSGSSW